MHSVFLQVNWDRCSKSEVTIIVLGGIYEGTQKHYYYYYESDMLLIMSVFCVQWKARSSASQGALDRGSYFTFCLLPAPHSPSGGVGCLSHWGQPHPQFLQYVSTLNPGCFMSWCHDPSSPFHRRRTAVLWPCWRRLPQSRADKTWQWPWWRSTSVRVWSCHSSITSTPEKSSTPVRMTKLALQPRIWYHSHLRTN